MAADNGNRLSSHNLTKPLERKLRLREHCGTQKDLTSIEVAENQRGLDDCLLLTRPPQRPSP